MATTKTRATQLVVLNGKALYATPTGIKITARGSVTPPSVVLGRLPKGEARRVRKAARAIGRLDIAAAKAQNCRLYA